MCTGAVFSLHCVSSPKENGEKSCVGAWQRCNHLVIDGREVRGRCVGGRGKARGRTASLHLSMNRSLFVSASLAPRPRVARGARFPPDLAAGPPISSVFPHLGIYPAPAPHGSRRRPLSGAARAHPMPVPTCRVRLSRSCRASHTRHTGAVPKVARSPRGARVARDVRRAMMAASPWRGWQYSRPKPNQPSLRHVALRGARAQTGARWCT